MNRKGSLTPFGDDRVAVKRAKVPFEFVLDALEPLEIATRPMFGCTAVYAGEKIVMVLRDKGPTDPDNGVWLATTAEHHASLGKEFASMRSITVFGPGVTGWQVLPEGADDFEESVLRACAMVHAGDARIGKVPARKKKKAEGAPVAKKAGAKRATAKKTGATKKAARGR
jgi:hypothetical protein